MNFIHEMRILFLSLVALFALSACERKLPPSMQPHVVTVEAGLKRLLALPPDDDNWVIFTDEKTELFVQFDIVDGSLVVDIPLIGRSKEQTDGLGKVFQRAGVHESIVITSKDPETLKEFKMRAYRMAFGTDTTKAAIFAVRVFNEAYGLSELKIGIKRIEANEPPPIAMHSKTPFTAEEALKDPGALLEGLTFEPADQSLNNEDLAQLIRMILQCDALVRNDTGKNLRIKKSWPLFKAIDTSLRRESEWRSFLMKSETEDSIDCDALADVVFSMLKKR